MKIFSGSSNKPLTQEIANKLQIPVSPLDIFIFPDGERRVRVLGEVLEDNAIAIQSTANPPDQNYMELFFIVDALKRSGAKFVTAVIPYLGYQRQDHIFRSGEAVSLEVIVETLEAVGVNRIITVDLHSPKIPELFNIKIDHLSALSIFAEKIKSLSLNNFVLVSPDMGGIRRIKILSELLSGAQWATIEKNRDLVTGSVEASKIEGKVKDKTAIIVDDMISSGGTIDMAVNLLLENGAKSVFVFATHPVFSGEAVKILSNSKAEKIFVTDSILVSKEKQFSKLEMLSISGIIAKAIV
ncbi:ribose-phosphate pyrophosphokinase [Patescibacteria group bacterium]|nr:ribose-phosphate pyrophosphokinase [Patescibacteria group bacterium]